MTFNLTLFVKPNVCTSRESKAKPNRQNPASTIRSRWTRADFLNQLIPPTKLFFLRYVYRKDKTSHTCVRKTVCWDFHSHFASFKGFRDSFLCPLRLRVNAWKNGHHSCKWAATSSRMQIPLFPFCDIDFQTTKSNYFFFLIQPNN